MKDEQNGREEKKLQIEGKSLVCLPFTSLCHKKRQKN